MIVYPDEGYNSFVSSEEADVYFENRLHSEKILNNDNIQEAALVTAFHTLNELDITIDPTDSAQMQALKNAQCEQTLNELSNDTSSKYDIFQHRNIKLKRREKVRFSERALAVLRPYMKAPTIQAVR